MTNKYCKVHYRKLSREAGRFPDLTLSKALSQALNFRHSSGTLIAENWRLRVSKVSGNEEHYRFLNDFHDDGESVFGNVCLFSPGQLQALIEQDPDAPVVDISEKRAPDGTDYLHAICYWLAIRDHFLIVQHISLQSKALEEYFTWLLREQTSVIQAQHAVQLNIVFDLNQVGHDLGDITAIEIGGVLPDTVRSEPIRAEVERASMEYDTQRSLGERVIRTFAKGKEILEAAIGPMETSRLIESMPEDAALEVNVGFGYRAKKRKFDKRFMSELEASLRNLPDGEVRVSAKSGNAVGNDARLQMDMPIKLVREHSSLLDNQDALSKLKEVYRRFLEDGRITD